VERLKHLTMFPYTLISCYVGPHSRAPLTWHSCSIESLVDLNPDWTAFVYALSSESRYYIGSTKTPLRRLCQHNGLLAGGAKRTRGARLPWSLRFLVPVSSWSHALVLEWHWKRAHRARSAQRSVYRNSSPLPEFTMPWENRLATALYGALNHIEPREFK
jgi:predicted GIY-YIG superfamily endonuclease